MTVTLPLEIEHRLKEVAAECGESPDRIIAAVMLHHLNVNTTDINPGWKLLDALEKWESGDRQVRRWTSIER